MSTLPSSPQSVGNGSLPSTPDPRRPAEPPAAASRQPCPTLHHIAPAMFLHVLQDIRNRMEAAYLEFFHNELVPDVRIRGVQIPVICHKEGDRYRIIDGQTRLLAALLTGWQAIPALVYETRPAEGDLKLAQLLANTMRQEMQPLELAAVYSELMTLNGWNQAQLAKAVNKPASVVAKVLSISKNLCPEVQAISITGKIRPRGAYALSKLSDHAKQLELANRAISTDPPVAVETIEEWVDRELHGNKKHPRKSVRHTIAGAAVTMSRDLVEWLTEVVERGGEVLKRLAKDPSLPPEIIPSLLK